MLMCVECFKAVAWQTLFVVSMPVFVSQMLFICLSGCRHWGVSQHCVVIMLLLTEFYLHLSCCLCCCFTTNNKIRHRVHVLYHFLCRYIQLLSMLLSFLVNMLANVCGSQVPVFVVWYLEADRISFSFSFSAPKNAFFYFSAFYFFSKKDAHIFGVFYFSVQIWP